MHNSIFTRFFRLCYTIIAVTLLVMGSVHIFLSIETYQKDTKEILVSNTAEAVEYIEARIASTDSTGELDHENAGVNYLNNLAYHTDCDYLVADDTGNILSYSEGIPECKDKRISSHALDTLEKNGQYSFGTLSGLFDESRFSMGYKIPLGNNGFVFLIGTKNSDALRAYVINLIVSLLIASVIILAVVYPILYYSIMRLINPINDMTMAAKRFGNGDFSEKVRVKDSTEMGYLADTLNDMASSLEQIEENRKSFVSNVSHELKTPMTTIGGFVDGILDGTIPKSQHRYYLKIVSEEVDRLSRLVRSMLNISKYESGEVSLRTESFEASSLIFKTALIFEKRINDKGVEMEGLGDGKFYLNADIDLFQQVIYNLTENAVKFVNDRGTISFSKNVGEEFTSICIRNTGEGLKENEISRVFDRFYKTDESRGKDKTGVGLGLSIVSSIIKLHNGKILVRSKPGEYTEFEFTLPTGTPPARKNPEEHQ